jgi:hypothetical protein
MEGAVWHGNPLPYLGRPCQPWDLGCAAALALSPGVALQRDIEDAKTSDTIFKGIEATTLSTEPAKHVEPMPIFLALGRQALLSRRA